jgi:hypothetical protein
MTSYFQRPKLINKQANFSRCWSSSRDPYPIISAPMEKYLEKMAPKESGELTEIEKDTNVRKKMKFMIL